MNRHAACSTALLACASLSLLAPGCLDARQGAATGVDGQHDADMAVATGCEHAGAPTGTRLLAADVDEAAMGRCGHVAGIVRDDGGETVVRLWSPSGDAVADWAVEGGWVSALAFSPAGDRLVFTIARSDLGFGDVTVVDLAQPAMPLAVVDVAGTPAMVGAPEAGGGTWVCDDGGLGRGPRTLTWVGADGAVRVLAADGVVCDGVVTRDGALFAPTDDALLRWTDPGSDAALVAAVAFDGRWHDGDTQRSRDAAVVSADGRLVIVGRRVESYSHAAPIAAEMAAYDAATGQIVGESGRGRVVHAMVADRGALVVIPAVDGAWWATPSGTGWTTLGRPVGAWDDASGARILLEIAAADGSEGLLWNPLPEEARAPWVASGLVGWRASADGAAVGAVHREGGDWMMALWRHGEPVARWIVAPGADAAPALRWVGDDGASVIVVDGDHPFGRRDTLVQAVDGRALWRSLGESGTAPVAAGDLVLVGLDGVPNDEIWAIDTRTGAATRILEGHEPRLWVDASGARIASVYGPLSGTRERLELVPTPRP